MHTGARRTKGSKDKMSVWVVCVCERREFLCCCDRQKNTVCVHKCHIRMRSRLLTAPHCERHYRAKEREGESMSGEWKLK